jgi:hypothetical protein
MVNLENFKEAAKHTGVGALIFGVFFAVVLAWNYVVGAFSNLVGLTEFGQSLVYFTPFALYLMYVMGGLYTSFRQNK